MWRDFYTSKLFVNLKLQWHDSFWASVSFNKSTDQNLCPRHFWVLPRGFFFNTSKFWEKKGEREREMFVFIPFFRLYSHFLSSFQFAFWCTDGINQLPRSILSNLSSSVLLIMIADDKFKWVFAFRVVHIDGKARVHKSVGGDLKLYICCFGARFIFLPTDLVA